MDAALPLHRGAAQQREILVSCATLSRQRGCGLRSLQMVGARSPQTSNGGKVLEHTLGLIPSRSHEELLLLTCQYAVSCLVSSLLDVLPDM